MIIRERVERTGDPCVWIAIEGEDARCRAEEHFVTPRASRTSSVYRFSVDVFYLSGRK